MENYATNLGLLINISKSLKVVFQLHIGLVVFDSFKP